MFPDDDGAIPLIIGDFAETLNTAFPGAAPYPSVSAGGMTYMDGTGPEGASGWETPLEATEPSTLAFNVPNWVDQEPDKWMSVQITFFGRPTISSNVFAFIGTSENVEGESLFASQFTTDPSLPQGATPTSRDLGNPSQSLLGAVRARGAPRHVY